MTSDPAGPESALGNCGLEGAERMRAIPSSSLPTGRGGLRPPLPRCPPGVQGAPGGEGPQKHAGPCRAGTRRGGGRGRTAPLRCADARRDPPTHGTVNGRSSEHPPSLTDTKRKKAFLPCAEDSEDPLPTGLPRRTAVLTKAAVSHSAAQRHDRRLCLGPPAPRPLLPASASPPFPAAWMPRELPETMHAGRTGKAVRLGRHPWPPARSRRTPRRPWDLHGAQDSAAGQVVGEGRPGLPGPRLAAPLARPPRWTPGSQGLGCLGTVCAPRASAAASLPRPPLRDGLGPWPSQSTQGAAHDAPAERGPLTTGCGPFAWDQMLPRPLPLGAPAPPLPTVMIPAPLAAFS